MIKLCVEASNDVTEIDEKFVNQKFPAYWEQRLGQLCDLKIYQLKSEIIAEWKELLPVYFNSGESAEETQKLLMTETEDDDMEQ